MLNISDVEIFQVHPVLMLIGYIIMGSEGNDKNVSKPLDMEKNSSLVINHSFWQL
jgi:hypothetical protein